jgi:hypothetical protein
MFYISSENWLERNQSVPRSFGVAANGLGVAHPTSLAQSFQDGFVQL